MTKLETRLIPSSKENTLQIALDCISDNRLLEELLIIAFSDKKVVSWHACWVIEYIAQRNTSILVKHTNLLIQKLLILQHPSQIRAIFGTVSILSFDCEQHLELLDFCIEKLTNEKSPHNEKSRALIVLEKFIRFEPDLKNELFPIIEQTIVFTKTAHFRKRLKAFLSL